MSFRSSMHHHRHTINADAPKLPSIPAEPIAKKKNLLSSDDFGRAVPRKATGWAIVMPRFPLENGTLEMGVENRRWGCSSFRTPPVAALRQPFAFPAAA